MEHSQSGATLMSDSQTAELMRVLVKAAMPLEVIRMSGWVQFFTPELRNAVDEAIMGIRNTLASLPQSGNTIP